MVIDHYGLAEAEVRRRFPAVYQWVLDRVKPQRQALAGSRDGTEYARLWWLHGKPRPVLRPALARLSRYIATPETAKHRTFQFLGASVLPDNMLIAIATDDALMLGILSAQVHVIWSLALGGRMGVGNDPRYNKSRCFETFPFPSDDTGLTAPLANHIRELAEELDAHRKSRQAAHKAVTLTGMYNILQKLKSGEMLSAPDRLIHEHALVSVLRSIHDELDAAVLAAYGWSDLRAALADFSPVNAESRDWATNTLLGRLVALNSRRAAEESADQVRWLRPEYQTRDSDDTRQNGLALSTGAAAQASALPLVKQAWPAELPEQVKAVADLLAAQPLPLTLAEIEARFSGRGRWRERLPVILQTLAAMGRARQLPAPDERWHDD
jgi:hypothetical protein